MQTTAEISSEHEFQDLTQVHGVTYDGNSVWFAADDGDLVEADPVTGKIRSRTQGLGTDAGLAFDGSHLWAICGEQIHRIDPSTRAIVATIPAPAAQVSGMAWAEGSLWIGVFGAGKILQVDPRDGRVLKTITVRKFVTGVCWAEGELWHGTLPEGTEKSGSLHRVDPSSGALREEVRFPVDKGVSGLEWDAGRGVFWCGEHDRDRGQKAKVRSVRRKTAP